MFSASELAAMKQTQEAHMPDRCLVYFISKKQVDEWGTPIKEKSDPVKTCCGLEMNLHNGNSQSYVLELIEADAVIRLPSNIEVHPNDEIEVTHRFGVPIAKHLIYRVIGFVKSGPSGQQATLKFITA